MTLFESLASALPTGFLVQEGGAHFEPVLPGLILLLPLLGFLINGALALQSAQASSRALREGGEWDPIKASPRPSTHTLPSLIGPGVMLVAPERRPLDPPTNPMRPLPVPPGARP